MLCWPQEEVLCVEINLILGVLPTTPSLGFRLSTILIDDSGVDDYPRDQLGKYADQTSPGSARMSGLSVAKRIDVVPI